MSEPITIQVTRYRCPHCQKLWSKKRTAVEHIARCWYNPDARGCKTCAFYYPGNEPCVGDPMCNCPAEPDGCTRGISWPTGFPITSCEKWEAVW